MSDDDKMRKRKICEASRFPSVSETSSSASVQCFIHADNEGSEDATENQTISNGCFHSTAECLQNCFDTVKSLFQSEDDANFRFSDGKAILTGSSGTESSIFDFSENVEDRNIGDDSNYDLDRCSRNQNETVVPPDENLPPNKNLNIILPETTQEKQLVNVNLQDERDEPELDGDNHSIVAMIMENKVILQETEVSLTKKKSSILSNVPKMETIPECEQYQSYSNPIELKGSVHLRSQQSLNFSTDGQYKKFDDTFGEASSSFHVRFDDEGWEETMTIDSKDTVMGILDKMHEPTANLWLATVGDVDGLQRALRYGALVGELDHLSRSALHLAVLSGSARAVRLLLEAGLDPNAADGMENTPLFYALLKRPSLTIATLLFQYGAKIPPRRAPTEIGLFLELVIMSKPTTREEKLMRLLLANGARLEDPEAPGGRQALHYAAMSNNDELIRALATLGADLNVVNNRGMTPMDVTVFYSCKEAQFCLEDIGITKILSDSRSSQLT